MIILHTIGAACFGFVIGWVLRFILAFAKEITVGSLSTIVSAVGGGAVTALFDRTGGMFSCYSIGLAVGFLSHVLLLDVNNKGEIKYPWRQK